MYQNIVVVGNLGRDPEMRYTASGTPVTSFSVATNRRWKSAEGEDREKTTWFRVSAWGQLAETCNQYLTKGQLVLVEGEVDASAWTGNDGEARASLELRARNVRFLSRRGDDFGAPSDAGQGGDDEGDLPF
jgi:single-strand DNA-binding protein